ncbi:hypothetical protein LY76DRAFT_649169 [Colletotrichum caudatum]|nr:hypothetical protein LY76DRAFT_649169 [Colletotrichum caudatum]
METEDIGLDDEGLFQSLESPGSLAIGVGWPESHSPRTPDRENIFRPSDTESRYHAIPPTSANSSVPPPPPEVARRIPEIFPSEYDEHEEDIWSEPLFRVVDILPVGLSGDDVFFSRFVTDKTGILDFPNSFYKGHMEVENRLLDLGSSRETTWWKYDDMLDDETHLMWRLLPRTLRVWPGELFSKISGQFFLFSKIPSFHYFKEKGEDYRNVPPKWSQEFVHQLCRVVSVAIFWENPTLLIVCMQVLVMKAAANIAGKPMHEIRLEADRALLDHYNIRRPAESRIIECIAQIATRTDTEPIDGLPASGSYPIKPRDLAVVAWAASRVSRSYFDEVRAELSDPSIVPTKAETQELIRLWHTREMIIAHNGGLWQRR